MTKWSDRISPSFRFARFVTEMIATDVTFELAFYAIYSLGIGCISGVSYIGKKTHF